MRQIMLRKIMEDKFRSAVRVDGNCPRFIDVYNSSTTALDKVIDTSNIPSIGYKTYSSASEYNTELSKIKSWLQIASKVMGSMIEEYEDVSEAYQDLSTRIFNESKEFKDAINKIINFSCIYIPPNYSNQTENSIAGKIGNYICLPFYIRTAKMYSGDAYIRSYSSGDITFTNSSRVSKVPLSEPLTLKITHKEKLVNLTVNFSVDKSTANMIYYRFTNECMTNKLSLFNGALKVYEKEFRDSEVLANFSPIEFDMVSISIDYINTNTDKPYSIQLDSFEIFEQIQFSKWGQFESKPLLVGNASKVENIGMTYKSHGDLSSTSLVNLISVSSDKDSLSYNKLEGEGAIDVSVHKFRHSDGFVGLENDPITYPKTNIAGKEYYQVSMSPDIDDLWNINYKHALVFHGLNADYAETAEVGTGYFSQHFENWTKVGTYWRSMIYVTDNDAWIDIGTGTCLINGRERTGKFRMPKGMSTVDVHEKDMDFKFGKEIISDLSKRADIEEDPLYPFNFAYMFSGLPEYDSNGDIESKLLRKFTVRGVTTLFLNEPFIPLSVEISDSSQVEPYKLQLTSGVSVPGTFSIEPNSGKIKVYPTSIDEDINVQVTYRRASLFRKPLGVMFNRLLTFMPIKALVGLESSSSDQLNYKYAFDNEAFFTLDGNTANRKLLLQNTSGEDSFDYNKIQHSQIIFNRTDENLYVSAKIEMETTDRYLTPVVKDIYLSM